MIVPPQDVERFHLLGQKLIEQADRAASKAGSTQCNPPRSADFATAVGIVAELVTLGDVDGGAEFFSKWGDATGFAGKAVAYHNDPDGVLITEPRVDGMSLIMVDRTGPNQAIVDHAFVMGSDSQDMSQLAVLTT